MRCQQLLALAALAAPALAATELSVKVYEGPTECADADKVKSGDYLEMHYTGTIDESSKTGEKGKKFDSSRDRGHTFDFQIGAGRVIKGWDEGIVGLCKGAKATLVIPAEMGYGASGAGGDIPGGATVSLLSCINAPCPAHDIHFHLIFS
jgi:FKBP-type peptidyl-prolyl cis-trans isomerase